MKKGEVIEHLKCFPDPEVVYLNPCHTEFGMLHASKSHTTRAFSHLQANLYSYGFALNGLFGTYSSKTDQDIIKHKYSEAVTQTTEHEKNQKP